MSRHKIPHLNVRNWENLIEENDADMARFEKLRHHQQPMEQSDSKNASRQKQSSHRTKPD